MTEIIYKAGDTVSLEHVDGMVLPNLSVMTGDPGKAFVMAFDVKPIWISPLDEGWTVTSHFPSTEALPTGPGWYLDNEGDLWHLDEKGRWWFNGEEYDAAEVTYVPMREMVPSGGERPIHAREVVEWMEVNPQPDLATLFLETKKYFKAL